MIIRMEGNRSLSYKYAFGVVLVLELFKPVKSKQILQCKVGCVLSAGCSNEESGGTKTDRLVSCSSLQQW